MPSQTKNLHLVSFICLPCYTFRCAYPVAIEKPGMMNWEIRTKSTLKISWTYEAQETCYFWEGNVIVPQKDGTAN